MSEHSPALQRICTAAICHFAEHGYDGASLSAIADLVGVRKASLYSHVAGKDALFVLCLEEAMAAEKDFAKQMFSTPVGADGPGAAYARALGERYENSAHMRFMLRAAFLPPEQHRARITVLFESLGDLVRQHYLHQMHATYGQHFSAAATSRYADAYQGIVESLCVELQYAGRAQMQRRYTAMWGILSDSLALHSKAAVPAR